MSKTEFSPVLRTRSAIANVAIKNGQLLAATDTGECFIDANNARIPIGDIIRVADTSELPLVPVSKLYFSEADVCLYYPTYVDGNLVWASLGGSGGATPGGGQAYVSGETLYFTSASGSSGS